MKYIFNLKIVIHSLSKLTKLKKLSTINPTWYCLL